MVDSSSNILLLASATTTDVVANHSTLADESSDHDPSEKNRDSFSSIAASNSINNRIDTNTNLLNNQDIIMRGTIPAVSTITSVSVSASAFASTPIPVSYTEATSKGGSGQVLQLRLSSSSSRHSSNFSRPRPIGVEDMKMMLINSSTRTSSSSSSNNAAATARHNQKTISATATATATALTSLGSRERELEQRDDLEDIRSFGRRQPKPTTPSHMKHNKMASAVAPTCTTRPTDAAMRLRFGLPPKKETSSSSSAAAATTTATHKTTTNADVATLKTIPATLISSLGSREREREQRDDLEEIRSTGRHQHQQPKPTAPHAKYNKIVAPTTRPTDAAMRLRFGLPPKKEMKDSLIVAKNATTSPSPSPSSTTIAVDASPSFRTTTTRVPSTTTCSTSSTNNSISTTSIIDNTIKSMNRFLSIPLSTPNMPEFFSCTGGSAYTTKTNNKNNQSETARHQMKKQLFLKLTSSQEKGRGDWRSGGTTPTTISTTTSSLTYDYDCEEEEEDDPIDGENEVTTTMTELSPRIMMFYQEEEEEEEENVMMMTPTATATTSPYTYSSPPSKLSSFADIALLLALNDTDDDDGKDSGNDYDDNEWGIFLSFSEDEQKDHGYNDCSSSPSMKNNVFHTPPPSIAAATGFGVITTT